MLGSQHDSGRLPLPKRMNFRKSSKQPLTPPLIFGKLYCKFFKLATKPSKDGANRTAFLKMYLVLIFINTIVEKHNLKRPLWKRTCKIGSLF